MGDAYVNMSNELMNVPEAVGKGFGIGLCYRAEGLTAERQCFSLKRSDKRPKFGKCIVGRTVR
ncbi:hypothetical protein Airi01_087800 [Actinoallomurus iriomotensis]|uniref:Uncharacterized protein n=1 Tax=Actinoallomurus iriomotensis TaxID=478107 RepID=A0A9W6VPZ8_9ACTN|nr:hypothetical protein Airi01_087800 [Actinoallomurus iriomotensis]